MKKTSARVLFIGDVVGRPGREYLAQRVAGLRDELQLDFVVANAENAAAGAGITGSIARKLLEAGVDAITLGDHVWDQRGFETEIVELEQVCRPANLPEGCPGRRWVAIERNGLKLVVFTMLGRQFLPPRAACPFKGSEALLQEINGSFAPDIVIAEIHAEATSEKIAFGRFLDGRVSGIVGTHTHVPTADATVLPNGSGYVTDLGMTGPYDSVIGRDVGAVVKRFVDGMPRRFPVATADVRISGALLDYDLGVKRATQMQLFEERKGEEVDQDGAGSSVRKENRSGE